MAFHFVIAMDTYCHRRPTPPKTRATAIPSQADIVHLCRREFRLLASFVPHVEKWPQMTSEALAYCNAHFRRFVYPSSLSFDQHSDICFHVRFTALVDWKDSLLPA